jgi:hypothetical protein
MKYDDDLDSMRYAVYAQTTSDKIGGFVRKATAWFLIGIFLLFAFFCAYVSIYYFFYP